MRGTIVTLTLGLLLTVPALAGDEGGAKANALPDPILQSLSPGLVVERVLLPDFKVKLANEAKTWNRKAEVQLKRLKSCDKQSSGVACVEVEDPKLAAEMGEVATRQTDNDSES